MYKKDNSIGGTEMNVDMIVSNVNDEILKIWDKYAKGVVSKDELIVPIFYSKDQLKLNNLLIIGLNPSFNIKWLKSFLNKHKKDICENEDIPLDEEKLKNIHLWKNHSKENYEKVKTIQKISVKKYPYFKKFNTLVEELKISWSHVDLFFYRVTGQQILKNTVLENGKKLPLNSFGEEQLELSLKLINGLSPKIILVQNAFSSEIFKNKWPMDFNNNENKMHFKKFGFDIVEIGGKKVPIFFSGMITGRRALDNHSFERLKWHIGKAYKYIEKLT